MLSTLLQTVEDLRANWPNLTDIDRAEALNPILASGMSGRNLARALPCSDPAIRRLKILVQATPEEKDLMRKHLLSTNAALRRIRDRQAEQSLATKESLIKADAKAANEGTDTILKYFRDQELSIPFAEQVLKESQRMLWMAEESGTLPRGHATGVPVAEIIRRTEPPSDPEDFTKLHHFVVWLSLWTFYAMPAVQVRDQAFENAWVVLARR